MAKADQLQGITSIAEPAPVMAAGGGVVAFQAGGIPPTRQEEVEQYLKERTGIMGEDEYLKALKARAEKEPSFSDRLSSGFTQIGLAGSMLRDPGQFGAYAKQAAELQGAQRKSAEERELAFLAAQRAERETKGKAFDVVEGAVKKLLKQKLNGNLDHLSLRQIVPLEKHKQKQIVNLENNKQKEIVLLGKQLLGSPEKKSKLLNSSWLTTPPYLILMRLIGRLKRCHQKILTIRLVTL
jgi:hypothetical protein